MILAILVGSHLGNIPIKFESHWPHTCDIFFEPDREIRDFSEGDWGLR